MNKLPTSLASCCADYLKARTEQLEHRDFYGGDNIELVKGTASAFDALVESVREHWKILGDAPVETDK